MGAGVPRSKVFFFGAAMAELSRGDLAGAAAVGAAAGYQAFYLLPHCDGRWIGRLDFNHYVITDGLEVSPLMVAHGLATALGAGVFAVVALVVRRRRRTDGKPGPSLPARRRYFVVSQAGALAVLLWCAFALVAPLAAFASLAYIPTLLLWGLAVNGLIGAVVAARAPAVCFARPLAVLYLMAAVVVLPQAYSEYFPRAYDPFGNRCGYDFGIPPEPF
jgi:hypothetical protein